MEKISSELPKIKTYEENGDVIVKIYILGISKEDIEIEIKDNFLKIGISKSTDEIEKEDGWTIEDWTNFSFNGMIALPCEVIPVIGEYSYNGSIVEIRLKKNNS